MTMDYKDRLEYYSNYYLKNKKRILKIHKKYIQSENGKNTQKNYNKNNVLKRKARSLINSLLANSTLTKDICGICGIDKNIEFHHENYDLPYFGYWFCKKHHKIIHRMVICRIDTLPPNI